ncbi:transporter substrate-binding domain-containing protein [uncultured Desulfosarcina sp.]|uniref:substrate-binding periplasmic protein n=1 Tax=uncultured Desulfosarcina sp. TaxID=218289 RepID=UPI0029C7D3B6|nr:transporter substrate-binding domain-containing protein [uncultured Desulfosarcina sp.]
MILTSKFLPCRSFPICNLLRNTMEKGTLTPSRIVFLSKTAIDGCIQKRVVQTAGMIGLCIVLFFSVPMAFGQDTGKIKLAAFDYQPFFYQESNEIHGLGVDLGNELFRRLHLETELTLYPLKRALEYMKDGTVDAIMILVKTPERERFLVYSEPLVPAKGYIWSAADRQGGPVNFERLEDLRPYKIGVTVGYSYGGPMDAFLKSINTDAAPQEYLSFKKLMAHRVDIVPATDIIAGSMIKKHPEFHGKFAHSSKPFHEADYYMGIGKKSGLAQMVPLLNKTITEMKAEGFVDKIIKKYTE